MLNLPDLHDLPARYNTSRIDLYNLIFEHAKEEGIELMSYRSLKEADRISNQKIYEYLKEELNLELPLWVELPIKDRVAFKLLYEVIRTNDTPIETIRFGGVVKNQKGDLIPEAHLKMGSKTTSSDAEGKFLFKFNQKGEYDLICEVEDYNKYSSRITLNTEVLDYEIILEPATSKYRFDGHVLDDEGQALMGATVRIYNDDNDYTFTSIEDGYFLFMNVEEGIYNLTCIKEEYISKEDVIVLNHTIIDYIIELTRGGYRFGGVTINDDAEIVPNANLKCGTIETTSNEEGNFIFNGLQKGTYALEGKAEGHYDYHDLVTINRNYLDFHIVFERIEGINYTVNVYDSFDETVNDADVTLKNNQFEYSVKTNNEGKAIFDNVETGTYNLLVVNSDSEDYTQEEIIINEESEKELTIHLTSSVKVNFNGKAIETDITGQTHGTAGVKYAIKNLTGYIHVDETDNEGRITLNDLPIGKYSFKAVDENFELYNKEFKLTSSTEEELFEVTRNKVNIIITPINKSSSQSVESDSLTLTDKDGLVWVKNQPPTSAGKIYTVKVPTKTLVPTFNGMFFDASPDEWMIFDKEITVTNSSEGETFNFNVRPLAYICIYSSNARTGDALECYAKVKNSKGVTVNEISTPDSKDSKYIDEYYFKYPLEGESMSDTCNIECVTIYNNYIRTKNHTATVAAGDRKMVEVQNNKLLNTAYITFRVGSDTGGGSGGTLNYKLTDSTGKVYKSGGITYSSGKSTQRITYDQNLIEGSLRIEASANNYLLVQYEIDTTFETVENGYTYTVVLNKI